MVHAVNDNNQPEAEKRIGRFQLTGELGEGAMAIVHEAFDPQINRTLAIKVLRSERAADAEYRHRFLSEAKAAGKLIHPNIVTIFDVGEVDKQPYIAMEYLEGKTLQDVMDERGHLPTRDVVKIGIQLASALDYAAREGVVHRDIKPSNIIVMEDNSVRITDFGIAHIETGGDDYTQHGTVLGTPQYMSPEQVEGSGVDGRSDLFSIGVVLYQMITGDKPFMANTLTSLLMKIAKDDPAKIAEVSPETPVGLRKIVEKLLAKSPDERFQTGGDLVEALQAVQVELDEQEDPLAQQAITPLKWKWTIMLALVVALVMLVAIYFVHTRQLAVMTQMVVDSGNSIAELIADESADEVLLQDWIAVDGVVQSMRKHTEVAYLAIYDPEGVIRASTEADDVGQPRQLPPESQRLTTKGDQIVSEWERHGEKVFDFEAPIKYQDRIVGGVQLGVTKAALNNAANLTLITMLGLMGLVLLAVVIATYVLVSRLSVPLRLLERGMQHVSHGNFGYRIHGKRNDELGRMFNRFNQMGESLEQQFTDGGREPCTSDDATVARQRPAGKPAEKQVDAEAPKPK